MAELRELQRKLDSVKALDEVVNAMRNLAAIYVRRAEAGLEAVRPYSEVVETSLAVLLDRTVAVRPGDPEEGPCIALVFAADQGLCGTYNDRVAKAALSFHGEQTGEVHFVTIGGRGHDLLVLNGVTPVLSVPSPTSLEGIKAQVPELASEVFQKFLEVGATQMFFIYNAYEGMGRFSETVRRVLPPSRDMLQHAGMDGFNYPPLLTAEPAVLLGALIEEYFFIELYRAMFESHSSENGARLLAMTAAGSNIQERIVELTQEFQTVRQDVITAELLDVVAGAEALKQD
jgi:F-type H+-transporting ATPase subunit gamma